MHNMSIYVAFLMRIVINYVIYVILTSVCYTLQLVIVVNII